MGILTTLVIGLVVGWLAGVIRRGKGFGILGNMVVGVIGGLLGAFLFRLFGLGPTNILGEIIAGTVGSLILLALIGWLGRKK